MLLRYILFHNVCDNFKYYFLALHLPVSNVLFAYDVCNFFLSTEQTSPELVLVS